MGNWLIGGGSERQHGSIIQELNSSISDIRHTKAARSRHGLIVSTWRSHVPNVTPTATKTARESWETFTAKKALIQRTPQSRLMNIS